jgi:hypothetical protein
VGRWTDTTKYPNLVSPAAGDLLPIADVSEDEGQRQRTITWGQLIGQAVDIAPITSYAASDSLDESDDLGAYVRVTAAATITLPNSFATGWQATIVNATDAADVGLAATGTLVLPAGFTEGIVNRRAVTVIHVGSNVWEVHGALVEGS